MTSILQLEFAGSVLGLFWLLSARQPPKSVALLESSLGAFSCVHNFAAVARVSVREGLTPLLSQGLSGVRDRLKRLSLSQKQVCNAPQGNHRSSAPRRNPFRLSGSNAERRVARPVTLITHRRSAPPTAWVVTAWASASSQMMIIIRRASSQVTAVRPSGQPMTPRPAKWTSTAAPVSRATALTNRGA